MEVFAFLPREIINLLWIVASNGRVKDMFDKKSFEILRNQSTDIVSFLTVTEAAHGQKKFQPIFAIQTHQYGKIA